MRKTNINDYGSSININSNGSEKKSSDSPKGKSVYKVVLKSFLTVFMVMVLTGMIAFSSVMIYVVSVSDDTVEYNVRDARLQLTSFVYVNDENGNPKEYQRFYSNENRVWADFQDIPEAMKNAIIAIEDKRFRKHKGVDWVRTTGAVFSLLTGSKSYGGSTITQQLIKNLTEDKDVSLTRKIREIFRALNFEKEYSKDEILEAYLNVVHFGSGANGVQAAANIYFGKNIKDCSIAECAAIAGITQNPSAYTPLVHPAKNKTRRETVLFEMYDQGMITKEEYQNALEESKNMKFTGGNDDSNDNNQTQNPVRNWHTEALFRDVAQDLQDKYNIGKSAAESMILTRGLKIYSAMDMNAQSIAEKVIRNESIMPKDKKIDLGYVMMDFDGRILATIGCRAEKTGDLWFDKANTARRQPGSTIKPIAVYAPLIDLGMYNYSSIIPDEPLHDINVNGELKDWPNNWYKGYRGNVTLQWALEKSANAPVAQLLKVLTPQKSYKFLNQKLGFTSLDAQDATNLSAFATGGTHVGVTVREMTAAFQIFGNGGIYNKPYTYFYVLDKDGNVILDNRQKVGKRAISSQTSTIMNRLLRNVVVGPEGTGRSANIPGWNVIAKTGTTNDDYDSWIIGMTPYAVSGIWTGYDTPKRIRETGAAARIWRSIMTEYLKGKPVKDYNYDTSVVAQQYCKVTGNLARPGFCGATATGYYAPGNMPPVCDGSHSGISSGGSSLNKPADSVESQVSNDSVMSAESTTNDGE